MVDHPVLGILGVLAALGFSMAGLHWWQTRRAVAPETVRKALHGLMGGVALTLPWVFDAFWPVAVLAGLSVALMLAVRRVPLLRRHVGGVLHGVGRRSYGEVCFPVAVCALFALSGGGGLSYTIPLLLLTLADSAAALVGVRLGRTRYATLDGFKSGEGSLAFFLVALPCVLVPPPRLRHEPGGLAAHGLDCRRRDHARGGLVVARPGQPLRPPRRLRPPPLLALVRPGGLRRAHADRRALRGMGGVGSVGSVGSVGRG